MASAKNATTTAEKSAKEPVKEAPAKAVSVYTAEELAKNHSVFKVSREIVVVALKQAKKDTATYEEAKAIIEKFKNRRIS